MGLLPFDWYPYKKGKSGHIVTHIGRTPGKDEDRDQGDTSASEGVPRMARKPPEAKGEDWNKMLPHSPQKKPTLPTPLSQTPNLQNGGTTHFCCPGHSVCGTLLRQPSHTYPPPEMAPIGDIEEESPFQTEGGTAVPQKGGRCLPALGVLPPSPQLRRPATPVLP